MEQIFHVIDAHLVEECKNLTQETHVPEHEINLPVLGECNYAEVLWNLIAPSFGLRTYGFMVHQGGPAQWICFLLSSG
jgi:hypothetical protein